MRIRQVRPEFWTDETLAALPDAVRLFYIGLWNVADDAGWFEWRPSRLGALLYPYRSASQRERQIVGWGAVLSSAGRLVMYGCDCAEIPTLSRHQRIAGKQSFAALEAHKKHANKHPVAPSGYQSLSDSPVEERRVEERNVLSVEELRELRATEDDADRAKLRATRQLHGHPA